MASIILVRHGQGLDPLSGDYDGLSPLGLRQAARIGEALRAAGIPLERAFAGTLQRQQLTARAAGATEIVVMPELDEHAGHLVVSRLMAEPELMPAELAKVIGEAMGARGGMARAVAAVVRAWALGELKLAEVEGWAAFRARVAKALTRLATEGGEGSVVVFTSGGFIGAAVAQALGLGDAGSVELGLAVDNASISELRFSRRDPSRLGLKRFNVVAHLSADELTGI